MSVFHVKIYVIFSVYLAAIQHSSLVRIAKGTFILFLGNDFLSFFVRLHTPHPFPYAARPIATITITVAWLFFSSFHFLLSDELVQFLLLLTVSPTHRYYMYFSLVSSDFALFSQPWYIWYSHVHINNVYRNLRAMLTSTFPLRLNIFVFIFFLCHSCAQMDPYNSATYTHTKRLSLNTPKIRYGFEIPEKKTRKFISLISRRRIKFRLVNIRSSGFRGWFRFICQNGEEKKKLRPKVCTQNSLHRNNSKQHQQQQQQPNTNKNYNTWFIVRVNQME